MFLFFLAKLGWWIFVSCVRSRGGVPPLHAAVPRGAAPRGAPPSRAPSSRGRGVQRARGAHPAAGYRPAPPIVQDTYGEYVSVFNFLPMSPCEQSHLLHIIQTTVPPKGKLIID